MVEPRRERGVEIADVAIAIDGEEAGRRVIEIVDGVLQFLEDVLLALAVARHVGDGPQRHLVADPCVAERSHPQSQPVHRLAVESGDAHLLLGAAAFPRRLEQAVNGFRNIGIADEDPFDRPHVIGVAGVDQVEIGGVGVDHPAARIGYEKAVGRLVNHRLEHWAGTRVLADDTQDARCQRK